MIIDAISVEIGDRLIKMKTPKIDQSHLEGGFLLKVRIGKRRGRLKGERANDFEAGEWYCIDLTTDEYATGYRAEGIPGNNTDAEPVALWLHTVGDLPEEVRGALRQVFLITGRSPRDPEGGRPDTPSQGGPPSSAEQEEIEELYREGRRSPAWLSFLYSDNYPWLSERIRWWGHFNVGQGACSAIYDIDGRPYVYVDFGEPLGFYKRTAPWNLGLIDPHNPQAFKAWSENQKREVRPPLCNDPLVVITHWDWDHWSLIKRLPPSNNLLFLVPEQSASGQAKFFWDNLPAPQKMVLKSGECREFEWGYVVRDTGTGKDNNQTGLSVYVRLRDCLSKAYLPRTMKEGCSVPAPVFHEDERYALTSGDAGFHLVPGLNDPNLRLIGLTAAHHGADSHSVLNQIPPPYENGGAVVYSYGLRDAGAWGAVGVDQPLAHVAKSIGGYPINSQKKCYVRNGQGGHPKATAIDAYQHAGWTCHVDTASNHAPYRPAGHTSPRTVQGNILLGDRMPHGYFPQQIQMCWNTSCQDYQICRARIFWAV